ncbi:hypothetical protein [Arthrobacter sp. MDT1-65]
MTKTYTPTPDFGDDLDFGPEDAYFIDGTDFEAEAASISSGDEFFLDHSDEPCKLTATDLEYLAEEGILPEVALAHGTYSVVVESQMPEELATKWDGPGIIFQNHRIDGSVVPQYRPTEATRVGTDGKPTKYVLPAKSGNSPYYSPLQKEMLGKAETVLVIEGTKACLSVVSLLQEVGKLDEIFVISVAGAWGGSEGGVHSPDFGDMLGAGATVTAFFDADFATNESVYLAAKKLQDFLNASFGASVKFARVPVSGKGGVSDWLGSLKRRSAVQRMDAVDRLIASAIAKLGRKPAAKKKAPSAASSHLAEVSAGGARVFRDLEMIARANISEDGKVTPGEILLKDAAIWLTAIHEVFDDMSQSAARTGEFDVAVKLGGGLVFELERVAASQLDNPRWILSQVPGALGETATIRPYAEKEIGEAIRASSGLPGVDFPIKRRLTRCGWYEIDRVAEDGSPKKSAFYLTGTGAIGGDGMDLAFTARIAEPTLAGFEMVDLNQVTQREIESAVAKVLEAIEAHLVDPTPVLVGLGFMALSVMGVKAGGGACIVGLPGSGKTAMALFLSSLQIGRWDEDFLGNFEGTSNYVAGVGRGVHNATVFVDDLRVRSRPGSTNQRSQDAQSEAFSQIMRRMYGGGGKARGRQFFDKNSGDVFSKEKARTAPGFILTAEPAALPDGHQNSDMERGLFVEVTKESTFRPGGASAMEDLANEGITQIAWAGFIQYLAGKIDRNGGLDEYLSVVRCIAEDVATTFRSAHPSIPGSRPHRIAANAYVGLAEFLGYAGQFVGIARAGVAARLTQQGWELTQTAMSECWDKFQGGQPPMGPLEALKGAVASGEYWIENYAGDPTKSRLKLGVKGETAGQSGVKEEVLFLLPEVVTKITGLKGKALGLALGEDIIPGTEGYMRRLRTPQGNLWMYAVKRSSWGGLQVVGSSEGWTKAEDSVAA